MSDEAVTEEATEEAPEELAAYDPFVPGQPIADFETGDKVRHISYPEGCYAVIGDFDDQTGWAMTAYGFEGGEIQFLVNAEMGGLGAEWEAYDG